MLLSVFYKPLIGIFFLFPLLPYQNILTKMQSLPFGKDFTDILIISIMIGTLLHARKNKSNHGGLILNNNINFYIPIIFIILSTFIGLIKSTLDTGLSFNLDNNYFKDWKNYMLLPLICILTYKNIKDRKSFKFMVTLLVVGIIGAAYSFYRELRWVDVAHFSDASRSKIGDFFVYIGANHYAAFSVYTLFILAGLLCFTRSGIKKLILLGTIFLLLRTILFTFSRGAYLGFLAGLFFLGLVKKRWLLVLFLILILSWQTIIPRAVVERIEMTKDDTGQLEDSAATRIELWQTAISMFKSSPLIGNGFNSFRALGYRDTHNIYMKMLAELGIIGLLSFLYLCLSAFITSWKLFRHSRDDLFKGLGLGFATCVIALMVTNTFGDRWSYLPLGAYFWIIFGLIESGLEIDNSRFA